MVYEIVLTDFTGICFLNNALISNYVVNGLTLSYVYQL